MNDLDTVCSEIILLSGDSFTLGPCRTVHDIKVHTSRLFPEFLPPEVIVFDEKHIAELENQLPAPMRVSVVLQEEDRNQRFWELSFEAFSLFGDLEWATRCLEEVEKHEPGYKSRKLAESARSGETFIVRALISNGVDINSLEVDGGNRVKRTALIIAANQGHTEVVQMLIENSATVDAREESNNWTALMRAVSWGRTEVAKMLIENSANIDAVGGLSNTWSPLLLAAHHERTETGQMLIENGVNINAIVGMFEHTALDRCLPPFGREESQFAQMLIENGARTADSLLDDASVDASDSGGSASHQR